MKKVIFALLSLVVLCQCQKPKLASDPPLAPTEITSEESPPAITNEKEFPALAYLGKYKGKLSCEGCPQGEVTLGLAEDFTYIFYGKDFSETGTFRWDRAGNSVLLEKRQSAPRSFSVLENKLVPSDGSDPGTYGLLKITETEEVAGVKPGPGNTEIAGIRWTLIEVNGLAVRKSGQKEYYLTFNDDGSFGGFAGCNNFGGKYKLSASRFKAWDISSTMMACENIKTEDDTWQALKSSDNVIRNGKVLLFRKDGKILMKLEALPTRPSTR